MLYRSNSDQTSILFQKVTFTWKFKKQTSWSNNKPFLRKVIISDNSVGITHIKLKNVKVNISMRDNLYTYFLKKFSSHLTFISLLNFNFLFLWSVRLTLLRMNDICQLSKLKITKLSYSVNKPLLVKNYKQLIKLI